VKEAPPEHLFAMGGYTPLQSRALSSIERYDSSTGQRSASASMVNSRRRFGACSVDGVLYVSGGLNQDSYPIGSVEKYSPTTDRSLEHCNFFAFCTRTSRRGSRGLSHVHNWWDTQWLFNRHHAQIRQHRGRLERGSTHARAAGLICGLRLQERHLRLWWGHQ
jgi:hypothetical protein